MKCMLCPRLCGVDRQAGETGFCGAPPLPVVARAARHDWEEPCISGSRGSGAIFFSGCNLGCVYCQNREISRSIKGKQLDAVQLRALFARLRDSGVHNINLVTGTPYADVIAQALEVPPGIPVVWNSGGYERPETLRMLEGKIDIYLPDMKYADDGLARIVLVLADGKATQGLEGLRGGLHRVELAVELEDVVTHNVGTLDGDRREVEGVRVLQIVARCLANDLLCQLARPRDEEGIARRAVDQLEEHVRIVEVGYVGIGVNG